MNNIKNSVQLIGHLGKTPELRTIGNGKAMLNLSIATNDYYKTPNGEKVQNTEWHRIIAWGKTAEIMSKILEKGNEVAIRGKLSHNSWQDANGITRNSTQVVVSEFVRLTKPKKAA